MGQESASIADGRRPTVREAQANFLSKNGLPGRSEASERWWGCEFGPVKLSFYNFDWRRKAIAHHDLHHVITDYPCTLAGEVQLAAWEFAAGRFPHAGATLFCLPLVVAGVIFLPKRTFSAFLRGRGSTSIYGRPIDGRMLDMTLTDLRETALPKQKIQPSLRDWLSFSGLISQSVAVTLLPAAAAALFCWYVIR